MTSYPALARRVGARITERARPVTPAGIALCLIVVLAGFLELFALDREGWSNLYYAAAIRSMLASPANFFFGSFDPGGFITLDKPPLGFWIEALSARIFGYNGVSLLLPGALAAIASVWLIARLVGRQFGRLAGLVAALVLAVTPISVATARNNTVDSLLVLAILLAIAALLRWGETGRLRWLVLVGVLVGVGFNVKMLEAYLVLPAIAAAVLVDRRWSVGAGSPTSGPRRSPCSPSRSHGSWPSMRSRRRTGRSSAAAPSTRPSTWPSTTTGSNASRAARPFPTSVGWVRSG